MNRIEWLGIIDVGQGLCSCRLSEAGILVQNELLNLEKRYSNLKIDKHIVMPNHVHAIVVFEARREQSPRPTTLMDTICAYKSITAKEFNKMNDISGRALWQTRFHDHIIRNENEYRRIWHYIDQNPSTWADDCYYVNAIELIR